MKRRKHMADIAAALCVTLAPLAIASCENDTYDSGDGALSYMRADFGEAHTDGAKALSWLVTDDLDTLKLTTTVSANWAAKADTTYRVLAYYNIGEEGAEPLSISQVPVLKVVSITDTAKYKTDAVTFESAWLSRKGAYLNIGFYIKTGKENDETISQKIGMRRLSAVKSDGKYTEMSLLFTHDQNGAPEYYSQRCYASVPLDSLATGCRLSVTLNTYDGTRTVDLVNE